MRPRPPLFARVVLRVLLNRNDRRTVSSDLREMYEQRLSRDGERAATSWWRRQWRQYPLHLLAERFRQTTRPSPRRPAVGANSLRESIHNMLSDLRHSVRSLARTPTLTLTIVSTLGLGIGATTAIFSVVNAVLIEPLPYADSDRLVRIYTDSPPNKWPFSVADYRALNEQQTSFSSLAGYRNRTMTFNRDDFAERVAGKLVTWNYFSLLGITPLHGSLFTEGDGAPGSEPKVIVSHGFWMRHLDGDENAIGRTLRFQGQGYTLVGVLPPDVGPFEHNGEFFAAVEWGVPPRKGPFFIMALARLAPGVDEAAAREELRAINKRLFPVWQASYQDQRASWGMQSVKEVVVGDVTATLVIVLGAVGFVLLIASTNAANLMVARATHRGRELAVRAALGASRRRLLQHLLAESTLLASVGALLGLVLTVGGIKLLTTVGADFIPRTQEVGLDGATVWFLLAITLGSGLLFGLIPSLHGAKTQFATALRSESRSATEGVGPRRLRRALVVTQFAVAAPLLIGAGLLIGTLANLQRVDPGLVTENVLTAAISLPASAYPEPGNVAAFWEEAQQRVGALPGVRGVVFADSRPPGQLNMINNFDLRDKPTPPNESQPATPWVGTTPGYFELLGIPLIEGRVFDDGDNTPPPVAIVDEAWARRFYRNESVLGRQFYSGGSTRNPVTVVGVVGDVKHVSLDAPDEGTVYWPRSLSSSRFRFIFIRTSIDPISVLPSVRQVFRELDPTLPLADVATIDELFGDSLDTSRYLTILVGAFAVVALLLSIIGIYGVMSYFVQQHTKDIGIRIALGGGRSNVIRMILGQGMRLVGVGVVVGIVGAIFLTRYMSSVLFEVGTTDALTFATVSIVMLGIALLACFVPARRAAGLDPATTLREE
ncbi:MAG: ABC transporter permease [Gemmatimonadetes bacterium]|nr:ABC transporter permease [Gemmatimonadota bacterium]